MKVIILGGGSAGWMTATTLLRAKPEWEISLIESKNISTVGVGESTLEHITNWCHYVGINEKDLEYQISLPLKIEKLSFVKNHWI